MKVKRVDAQYFFLGILTILAYLWPYYFSVLMPGFSNTLKLGVQLASYGVTILLVIMCRKKLWDLLKRSQTFICLNLALLAVLLLSTIIHRGKMSELVDLYKLFFLLLLLGCAMVHENDYLLKGIAFLYNVIIILSFLDAIVHFPKLIGSYHFAVTKNVYMRYIYLGIILDAYLDFREKGDISVKTIVFLGLISVTSLLYHSSTGFAAPLIVIVLLIIRKFILKNNMRLAKSRIYLYVSVGIGVLVIFLRQFTFYESILEWMGKNLTFTGRTIIWDQAIERIKQSPIIGSGHISPYGYQTFGNENWSSQSSHNIYMDVMIETGIIGLVIFFLILLKLTRDIDHCKNQSMGQCFSILFLCFLLAFDFDVFFNASQYMFTFPVMFFLSFIFAGNQKVERRVHFVWGKSRRKGLSQ